MCTLMDFYNQWVGVNIDRETCDAIIEPTKIDSQMEGGGYCKPRPIPINV